METALNNNQSCYNCLDYFENFETLFVLFIQKKSFFSANKK